MSIAPEPAASPRARDLAEPLLATAAIILLALITPRLESFLPWLGDFSAGALAVGMLLIPLFAGRLFHHESDPASPWTLSRRGAILLLLAIAVAWPLFFAAFLFFHGALAHAPADSLLAWARQALLPNGARWLGLAGGRLRLPDDFLALALTQVIVVAIPEEYFFRGYLLGRFEQRWPSRHSFLGGKVGWPLLASALLFGLGHALAGLAPSRFAVAVPALFFGWMRAASGSLLPGALFHALCNLFAATLYASFFA